MPPFQQGGASRLISWLNNYAAEFGSVFIFGFALKGRDKLLFSAFLPSPLGRVAERSEVGRGLLPHCICFAFSQKATPKTSSVSPSGCHLPQRGRQGAARTATSNNNLSISFWKWDTPMGREKRLIGVLLFGGQVCCPAQEGIGGHRLREPQGEAHLGDAGLGEGCAI